MRGEELQVPEGAAIIPEEPACCRGILKPESLLQCGCLERTAVRSVNFFRLVGQNLVYAFLYSI
jgi:hypothetical protein